MPTIAELRRRLSLSHSVRPPQVLTKAIRQLVPGGNDLIEALTRLHEYQHSKPDRDPILDDVLRQLRAVRSAMANQAKNVV